MVIILTYLVHQVQSLMRAPLKLEAGLGGRKVERVRGRTESGCVLCSFSLIMHRLYDDALFAEGQRAHALHSGRLHALDSILAVDDIYSDILESHWGMDASCAAL